MLRIFILSIVLFISCDDPVEEKYYGEEIVGKWASANHSICYGYNLLEDQYVPIEGLVDSGFVIVTNSYFTDTLRYLRWDRGNSYTIGNRAWYDSDYENQKVSLNVELTHSIKIGLSIWRAPENVSWYYHLDNYDFTEDADIFKLNIAPATLFDLYNENDTVHVEGAVVSPGIIHVAEYPHNECSYHTYSDSDRQNHYYEFYADGKYDEIYTYLDTVCSIPGTYELRNDSLIIYNDYGWGPYLGRHEITDFAHAIGESGMTIQANLPRCQTYPYNGINYEQWASPEFNDCLSHIEYLRDYEVGSLMDARFKMDITFKRIE